MLETNAPKHNLLAVLVNGRPVLMPEGSTVAAALLNANAPCRKSVTGEPRTALCGMGICFECRAVIDGVPHQRSCQIPCRNGMEVETQP
jgi:predicted molibdopterin-dependent oxidoreductase YjgC